MRALGLRENSLVSTKPRVLGEIEETGRRMAKRDYYEVLGVPRGAGSDQIKKAYRRLARKYHPDATGNDPSAAEQFKEVQEAYEVLQDAKKRQAYDRFGHAAANVGSGWGPGGPGGGGWAYRGEPGGGGRVNFDFSDVFGGGLEGIFEQMRAGRGRKGARQSRRAGRGENIECSVRLSFDEAIQGASRDIVTTVEQSDGGQRQERLTVKIPAGINNGDKVRLRGRGQPGLGGNNGDLIVKIEVAPHRYWQRQGNDIYLEVPLTVSEAALGTRIDVPTLAGTTTVTVPAGSSSGRKLRLKEKGVKSHKNGKVGDMFLTLKIVPPKEMDERSRQLLSDFAEHNRQEDIRQGWQ